MLIWYFFDSPLTTLNNVHSNQKLMLLQILEQTTLRNQKYLSNRYQFLNLWNNISFCWTFEIYHNSFRRFWNNLNFERLRSNTNFWKFYFYARIRWNFWTSNRTFEFWFQYQFCFKIFEQITLTFEILEHSDCGWNFWIIDISFSIFSSNIIFCCKSWTINIRFWGFGGATKFLKILKHHRFLKFLFQYQIRLNFWTNSTNFWSFFNNSNFTLNFWINDIISWSCEINTMFGWRFGSKISVWSLESNIRFHWDFEQAALVFEDFETTSTSEDLEVTQVHNIFVLIPSLFEIFERPASVFKVS